jgi:Peptidase A4 family
MKMNRLPGRRAFAVLAAGTLFTLGGGFALDAVGASAQTVNAQQQVSGNWSGYIAQGSNGQNFSSVSGSWTQPAVNSSSTQAYSAFWVGLGGASQQSDSLEQVGTAADTAGGQTTYYAWYELVPAGQVRLNLAIHPGDQMTGRVTVNGTNVTVSLSDKTTGQSVTRTLTMSNPDTSSAEWIAEAPSAQSSDGSLHQLPLANFGSVTFTNASATAGGHTGGINDPNWTLQQVELQPSGTIGNVGSGGPNSPAGLVGISSSASASAGSVASDGSSFTVTVSGSSDQSSAGSEGDTGGYAYPGYGYGGAYGYSGGGYPGGYIYGY